MAEIERMEKKDLRKTMDVYAELIVEYRHMLRNINKEHMKQQIKEELQIKILKQHEDRYHKSRIIPKTDPRALDKADAHFSEEQQGTRQVGNWQVRLEEAPKEAPNY